MIKHYIDNFQSNVNIIFSTNDETVFLENNFS